MTYSATISVVPFNGKILFVSWQFIHSAHHQGRALGDAVTLFPRTLTSSCMLLSPKMWLSIL